MIRNKYVWVLSLAMLGALPAGAAMQTYATLAEWQAAATQLGATIDFTSSAQNPGDFSLLMWDLVPPGTGIMFSAPSEYVQVVNAGSEQGYYNWGTGAILRPSLLTGLIVKLPTPASAFSTFMMINNGASASSMTVTVKNGGTTLDSRSYETSALPTPTFFGVAFDGAGEMFDSITFTPATNYAVLDNVRVGSYQAAAVSETPEPGTGALAACGVVLFAAGLLRRRRKSV